MIAITHKEGTEFNLDVILYEELLQGIVLFEFEKSDGTIRKAYGTLKSDLIPKFDESKVSKLVEESRDFITGFSTDTLIKGDDEKLLKAIEPFLPKESKSRTSNPEIQNYYDLESRAWRSLTKSSLKTVYQWK